MVSPRPTPFHWDDYRSLGDDYNDSSDQDDLDYKGHRYHEQGQEDSDDDDDLAGRAEAARTEGSHEDSVRRAYQSQFEGHHSLVRRRSSFSGRSSGGGHGVNSFSADSKYDLLAEDHRYDLMYEESKYDSMRHGIGQSVSDVSDELAKARLAMSRASQAMKSMEQELEAMQLSIGNELHHICAMAMLLLSFETH